MRCSCGEHDLGPGPYEACHFCGHPTTSRPGVDWGLGRLYVPICHACSGLQSEKYTYADTFIPIEVAPPALLARAIVFQDSVRFEGV